MMPRLFVGWFCLFVTFVSGALTHAAFVVNISEVGSDVVATGAGTLNTSGFTVVLPALGTSVPIINSQNSILGIGNTTPVVLDVYLAIGISISGPASFGTGGGVIANGGNGNRVEITGPTALALDSGYVSGSSLNSTSIWNNQSFASLGITPGTYTWTWGENATADSFTINAIPAVPEPSSSLLGAGLGAAIYLRKRKR